MDCTLYIYSLSQNVGGEFNWDASEQGLILGSFALGSASTQLVGGILAEKYGAKWVYGGCSAVGVLLDFLTPSVARIGPMALAALRALQEGLPVRVEIFSQPVPREEFSCN